MPTRGEGRDPGGHSPWTNRRIGPNYTPPSLPPAPRLADQFRVVAFGVLQGNPEIVRHVGWLNLGGIELARGQIVEEEASVPTIDIQFLETALDKMRLKGLQQGLAGGRRRPFSLHALQQAVDRLSVSPGAPSSSGGIDAHV